jgi:hypothetical protein
LTFAPPLARDKGSGRIYDDINFIVLIAQKIALRYLGSLEHPISHELIERSKDGQGIALEISPKYYSTWDHDKQKKEA